MQYELLRYFLVVKMKILKKKKKKKKKKSLFFIFLLKYRLRVLVRTALERQGQF